MAPRLRWSEALAGLASALLLASLFLPWFGPSDVTAWEAFALIDLLLLGAAALGLFMAFAAAAYTKPDVPITTEALSVVVGVVATLLVIFRLIDPVNGATREVGLYIGLAGALGLLIGAWGAVRSER